MAKGSYPGGGTIIGPQDVTWFGNSGVKGGPRGDADQITRRQANPLTAEAEERIKTLRVDIAGLASQIATAQTQLERSREDLSKLLHKHGLPPDPASAAVTSSEPQAPTARPTRNQRRKRAREKYKNGG